MKRPLFSVILATCLMAGCGKQIPLVSTPDLQVTQQTELPIPLRTDMVATDRASYIGPLDSLYVDVFGVSELSREIPVDSGGRIAMPLVGTIDANGMTATELAERIRSLLVGRYVRNPQVTVNIRASQSQVVTVDGSVNRPGLYPVTNQTTLMRAIATGGGLTEFAKVDDVVILRTVDNKKMAGLYNIGQIRRGQYVDPAIYPNDIIIVGDSPARRRFKDILQVAPLLTAPLVAILQR